MCWAEQEEKDGLGGKGRQIYTLVYYVMLFTSETRIHMRQNRGRFNNRWVTSMMGPKLGAKFFFLLNVKNIDLQMSSMMKF